VRYQHACAKLIKKDELKMSTGINNGKLNTNNIYILKLISLILSLTFISGFASSVKKENGWVVVIDAGHGGRDSGAQGSFSYEKNIALAIALKTGEYIEKNLKNVTVLYTRKNDTFVELQDRANFANKNNADLFISIHANWAKSKTIRGTETFIMGLAKDEQNLEVAMKENEVILLENDYSTKYDKFDPKSPESYVMFTLMQNIFQEQSTALASKIQNQFKNNINRTDRGVKQAGFWVLFMTTMPSVLTETGFITSPEEEKYLNSKQGQDNIAASIFRACRDYLDELNSKTSLSWSNTQGPVSKSNITQNTAQTNGKIVFMVQIATSSVKNDIRPENFQGLTEVVEIDASGRYKYAIGNFTDYTEAVKFRKKIELLYHDAFVIAVRDNKVLPLQQALDQNNNTK